MGTSLNVPSPLGAFPLLPIPGLLASWRSRIWMSTSTTLQNGVQRGSRHCCQMMSAIFHQVILVFSCLLLDFLKQPQGSVFECPCYLRHIGTFSRLRWKFFSLRLCSSGGYLASLQMASLSHSKLHSLAKPGSLQKKRHIGVIGHFWFRARCFDAVFFVSASSCTKAL